MSSSLSTVEHLRITCSSALLNCLHPPCSSPLQPFGPLQSHLCEIYTIVHVHIPVQFCEDSLRLRTMLDVGELAKQSRDPSSSAPPIQPVMYPRLPFPHLTVHLVHHAPLLCSSTYSSTHTGSIPLSLPSLMATICQRP